MRAEKWAVQGLLAHSGDHWGPGYTFGMEMRGHADTVGGREGERERFQLISRHDSRKTVQRRRGSC